MGGVEDSPPDERRDEQALLCKVGSRLCALPLGSVIETLRPLPVEPLAGAPAFVAGLSVIRGTPLPVVDVAMLLGAAAPGPARFVTVRADGHRVALAVGAVLGIRVLSAGSLQDLPALLREASADVVAAIGSLDSELLLVLRTVRLVPDGFWESVPSPGEAT